jgi:hypothetical protein
MLTFHCRFGITALILACCLSGCAGAASAWQKPGVSAAQRGDDLGDCQDETRQATQREYAIDQDIDASRAASPWNADTTQTQQIDTADAAKSDNILAACMIGKGYSPAS